MTSFGRDVQAVVTSGLKRTTTLMTGIARGLPIFDVRKLLEATTVDLEDRTLWLKDEAAEQRWGFKLNEAIERARTNKVFQGYSVLVPRRETVTMDFAEFRQLVLEAGGEWVGKFNETNTCIVVGDENDAHKYPAIWSQNVVLDAVFKQTVDLNKNRVL